MFSSVSSFRELFFELGPYLSSNFILSSFSFCFVANCHYLGQLRSCDRTNPVYDFVTVVNALNPLQFVNFSDLISQCFLKLDDIVDPLLRSFQAIGQYFFCDLRGPIVVILKGTFSTASLNHHDGNIAVLKLATGNNHFKR